MGMLSVGFREKLFYEPEKDNIEVFLLDDDASLVGLTATFLERKSDVITTTTETSPEEALETLVDGEFDCIVCDYEMPVYNGLEFLKEIRSRGVDIPFILFTGKGSEEIASKAISAGVDEYLQKGGTEKYDILAQKVQNLSGKFWAEKQAIQGFLAVETVREGIAIIGNDGRYKYMNPSYATIYNSKKEDLIGNHWECLYTESETKRFIDNILPTLEEEGTWSGRAEGVTVDGEIIEENLVLTQMDDGGHICIIQESSDE